MAANAKICKFAVFPLSGGGLLYGSVRVMQAVFFRLVEASEWPRFWQRSLAALMNKGNHKMKGVTDALFLAA